MRSPDEVVGDPKAPQILRWLIWRTRFFQIVLHKWLQDDDSVPHDHSWWNVSIRLSGGAIEYNGEPVPMCNTPATVYTGQPLKRVTFRRATDRHFILLTTPHMWTLFITGPHVREWGYWVRERFVPWKNYRSRTNA